MAHVLNGTSLSPVLFSELALRRIRTKVSLLKRIYTESRIPQNAGGDTFYVTPPPPIVDPVDFDSAADHTLATPSSYIDREPFPVTYNRHKIHRIEWNLFESRLAIGNFEDAWNWAFGGFIDGIIRTIERDIAAKYTGAARTVGSSASAISDATLRAAIVELSKENIDPRETGDVHFVVTPQGWFEDLLSEDRYARYDAAGGNAALANLGKLASPYGLEVDYSPAIVGSYGSGGATAHNMLFHRHALGISFKRFESVSKYVSEVGQNVEEDISVDSEGATNVTIRTQVYYDNRAKKFVLELDVAWVAYVMVSGYLVDFQSTSA